MTSSVTLTYRNGRLNELVIQEPTGVNVSDCRFGGGPSFISVGMGDDDVLAKAYLPPGVARELYDDLGKLFDPPKETEA